MRDAPLGVWAALLVLLALYVVAGDMVAAYQAQEARQHCPGHRIAQEKYSWARPLIVATWPIAVMNEMSERVIRLVITPRYVCDRFDPVQP